MPPLPRPNPPPELVLGLVAIVFVALALASMGALHERHYRDRRRRLLEASLAGIEIRLRTVEDILREDRLT